ncbi:hypothetical protein PIROE2DRAFT_14831 [Piromyces sp. E2]|nr:hypothetical protein PIROE2DRAFT_14831 [Piromyces sp. E2]|eukprot:OUM59585.1 hypothetical protein PIROE2DRAFT_14831 [Piromyces sp. E2]
MNIPFSKVLYIVCANLFLILITGKKTAAIVDSNLINDNSNNNNNTNTNSNVNSNLNSNVNSNVNSNANSNANSNTNSNMNSNTNSNANFNTNSNVNSNTNSNANSNTNSNVNTNTNSNENSNTNTNANSNIDTKQTLAVSNSPTNNDCSILYTVLEELSVPKSHVIYKNYNNTSRCCNLSEEYINCNENNNIFEVKLGGLSTTEINFPCSVLNLPRNFECNITSMNYPSISVINNINVAGFNDFKGFITNKENIKLETCYKPCNENFQSKYEPDYWPYPCIKSCLSSFNSNSLEYQDLYSSIILKNSIDNNSIYNSKLNSLDCIILTIFIGIIIFYILYFYNNVLRKNKTNRIKTPTFGISPPKKQNDSTKTSSIHNDSQNYHPRMESIRTQTPINSPRKRSKSNINSVNSHHDSIIKTSISPSMMNDNEIPHRQSFKQHLYNSLNSIKNMTKEMIEGHDPMESSVHSSYPAYPEECVNLSRLSVESVKGSIASQVLYDSNNDGKSSPESSFSKKEEEKFLYKNNNRQSVSSVSAHFDINDISVPSPVYNNELREKSIVKSNHSPLQPQNQLEYSGESVEENHEEYYYDDDDEYMLDSRERLISEGKTVLDTNSFTEEYINEVDKTSETLKISEVSLPVMTGIECRSIRNNEIDYSPIKSINQVQEDPRYSDHSNRNSEIDPMPIKLVPGNDSMNEINKSHEDNLNSKEFINIECVKVTVTEPTNDNESISIEDSLSSKDEIHNKNIPDNTSYLGMKSLNKKVVDNSDRRTYDSGSILKDIDYSYNENGKTPKTSLPRSKRSYLSRNNVNNKRLSNLLRKSYQQSENNSICFKRNLINCDYDKENINSENINDHVVHKLPPLEISNEIIINSILNGHDDSEHTYYHKQNMSETTLPRFYDHENNSFNCSSQSTLSVIKRNNSSSVYEHTNNMSPYDNNYRKLRNLRMSSININRKPSTINVTKIPIDNNIIITNKNDVECNSNHGKYSGGGDGGSSSSTASSIRLDSIKDDRIYSKSEVDLYRSNSNPIPRPKLYNVNEYDLPLIKRFNSTLQRSKTTRGYHQFKYSDIFEIRKSKKFIDSKYRDNDQVFCNYDAQLYSPISPEEEIQGMDEEEEYGSEIFNYNNDMNYFDIQRSLSPIQYSSPKEYIKSLSRQKSSMSTGRYTYNNDTGNSQSQNNYFGPDLDEQEKNRIKCQELYSASLFNSPYENDNILSSSPANAFIRNDNNDNKSKIASLNNTIQRSLSKLKKKNINNGNVYI